MSKKPKKTKKEKQQAVLCKTPSESLAYELEKRKRISRVRIHELESNVEGACDKLHDLEKRTRSLDSAFHEFSQNTWDAIHDAQKEKHRMSYKAFFFLATCFCAGNLAALVIYLKFMA